MAAILPPQPPTPLDPKDPRSVALWKRLFFEPLQKAFGNVAGIAWGALNLSTSKLSDLGERTHAMLQSVLGWESSADTTATKHISNAQGKVWDDHAAITDANPHGTDHSALENIIQSDDTLGDSDPGKHVTNAQVKKYEDHRLDNAVHNLPPEEHSAGDTLTVDDVNKVHIFNQGASAVSVTYPALSTLALGDFVPVVFFGTGIPTVALNASDALPMSSAGAYLVGTIDNSQGDVKGWSLCLTKIGTTWAFVKEGCFGAWELWNP